MLGPSPIPPVDSSAMASRSSDNGNRKGLWCEHCQRQYHTKATCWKIHGKPADWVPKSSSWANWKTAPTSAKQAADSSSDVPFSKAHLDHLSKLLSNAPPVSSSLMVQKGIASSYHADLPNQGEPWIIDSDASDHMTGNRNFFSSYTPCLRDRFVKIADDSFTRVMGIGSVSLSSTLHLRNVLYVPGFTCNLLSISKLTGDSLCVARFSPSSCVFQDRISGQTIGNAREDSGLYYFMRVVSLDGSCQMAVRSSSRRHQVMLLHYRLGHPSFLYLRRLFPSLFRNNDFFSCEVCQLAKHKRVCSPPQPYQASCPFALVHSDLWGPSRICTRSNKRWFLTFIDDHPRVCWVSFER